MNCHSLILKEDPRLQLVRDSTSRGIHPWVQIHKVPDYVYFNHLRAREPRRQLRASCHGEINQMDEVYHAKPLPWASASTVTANRKIHPPAPVRDQLDWKGQVNGKKLVHDWNVKPGESCSVCHR